MSKFDSLIIGEVAQDTNVDYDGTVVKAVGGAVYYSGFAAANISAFHPDLSHVVVLSGFVSVQRLVDGFFSGLMKLYRPAVMRLERQCNPRFVDCDAVTSLSQTQARVLLIYSEV